MGRLAESLRSLWFGPYSSGDPALARLFGGTPAAAGISVNEYTALNFSAVWQAVTLIAGGIASLPLILYKRLPTGGKDRFPEHPLYRLLHDKPNPEMGSMVWRETMLGHCLTWGNGYSEIQFDQAGRPIALWPIAPERVTPYREQGSGRLRYRVLNDQTTGYRRLEPDQVFHVRGFGPDGICGYSVIRRARESVSLGLATERYGARFFGSGALFSIALEHPGRLGAEAQKRLKESWKEQHEGVDRSHGVAVLEEGMKATKLSIPPEDAQYLETRKFQAVEIARWYNLSPYKLRDIEKAASYSSVEQAAIDHVTDCLRPWMVRFEQEIGLKLIRPLEQGIQFAEHLVDGLLRGVTLERYQAYAVARNMGVLSADDIREKENMNPLPDGQGRVYLVPMNMVPADKIEALADAQIEAKTQPAAEPPAEPDTDADDEANARIAKIVADLRAEVAGVQQAVEAGAALVVERIAALPEPEQGLGPQLREDLEALRVATETVGQRIGETEHRVVERVEGAEQATAQAVTASTEQVVRAMPDVATPITEAVETLRADGVARAAELLGVADVVAHRIHKAEERLREHVAAGSKETAGALALALAQVVQALPPPPDVEAVTRDIVEAVRAESTVMREAFEHQATESTRAAEALAQAVTETRVQVDAAARAEALARDLADLQRVTVGMIAGKLVRREIAQAKKCAADPEHAAERLAAFYQRFVADVDRELRALRPTVTAVLVMERWAATAQEESLAALADGGLTGLLLKWVERHDMMTNVLLEVLHGEG